MFYRALFCVGMFVVVMRLCKQSFSEEHLPRATRKVVLLRALLCLLSLAAQNYSYQHIPLTHSLVAFNIFPMLSVLIAFFLNREPLLFSELAGMAACFLGIYVFAAGKQSSGDAQNDS